LEGGEGSSALKAAVEPSLIEMKERKKDEAEREGKNRMFQKGGTTRLQFF